MKLLSKWNSPIPAHPSSQSHKKIEPDSTTIMKVSVMVHLNSNRPIIEENLLQMSNYRTMLPALDEVRTAVCNF